MERDEKKRVVFVITKSNFGGAQRYVYDLATSLPSERYETSVALGGTGTLYKTLIDAGVQTTPLASLGRDVHLFNDVVTFFALRRLFRTERPDIVHLNSSKVGGLGALAARTTRVPRVLFTAHGLESNSPTRGFFARLAINTLTWVIVLLSHETIAVSGALAKQLSRFPFTKGKITTVQNGIRDIHLLPRAQARDELIKQHPTLSAFATEDDIWIGTVAELHPVKGLSYAIEAIDMLRKQSPCVRYLVIGEGEGRKQLQKLINSKGLQEHVFLLGFMEGAPRYSAAYDLFVFPSLSEALGLAALEAGAAGLPVVATCVGGIPEIIEHEKTGLLVPPKDSDAIAAALKRLIGNEPFSKQLGAALRERVEHSFTLERMVYETLEVYEG